MSTVASESSWIARGKVKQRPELRLFCFPFAGGAASAFRPWAKALPPGVELCPIQLPGREDRFNEPPVRELGALVRALMAPLLPLLDLPFAFFGHSMGGVVAWEVARELQRRGRRGPARLFVSGCVAPRWMSARAPVYQLPDGALLEHLRSLNGIPEEVLGSPELLSLVLPVFRADMEIYDTFRYVAGEPLHAPVSIYVGEEDHTVPREQAAAWGELTDAGSALTSFPGDHFFIMSQRDAVIGALSKELGRAPL